jgi:hypothetical protein
MSSRTLRFIKRWSHIRQGKRLDGLQNYGQRDNGTAPYSIGRARSTTLAAPIARVDRFAAVGRGAYIRREKELMGPREGDDDARREQLR